MTATYFVKTQSGRNTYWAERDTNETDRSSVIHDLIAGDIEGAIEIWCAEDGRWNDVSADIARQIFDAESHEPFKKEVADFLERHLPDYIAVQLRRAA